MTEAQGDRPEFISPSMPSLGFNRFRELVEAFTDMEQGVFAPTSQAGLDPIERSSKTMTQHSCHNCDFFARVPDAKSIGICNAAEPDIVMGDKPDAVTPCKHWEEKDLEKRRKRSEATLRRVRWSSLEETPQLISPERLDQMRQIPQVRVSLEELTAIADAMGVPNFVSTPNSEPNPFYCSEQQLADAMSGPANGQLSGHGELLRALARLTEEELASLISHQRRMQGFTGEELARRNGYNSNLRRNRNIQMPRMRRIFREAVSMAELEQRMRELPPAHLHDVGQRLSMIRFTPADFNRDRPPTLDHTYDRLTFEVQSLDGFKCWVYYGPVVMD